MNTNNKKIDKLAFLYGGLLLFILGFDVLMIVHYFKNLSGPSLIAVASIVAGTFLAIMAAWFCCKPTATTGLKIASFGCKVALIIVGGLSATSIITLYFHEKAEAKALEVARVQGAQKAEVEIAKINAEKAAKIEEQNAEIKRLEALKAAVADVRKTAGARAASQLVQGSVMPSDLTGIRVESTPSLISNAQALNAKQAEDEEMHTFKAWLLEYSEGGVYYVPTLANLLVFITLGGFLVFARSEQEGK